MSENMIRNGSFESKMSYWNAWEATAEEVSVTTAEHKAGRHSLKFCARSRERWIEEAIYGEQLFERPAEAEELVLFVKSGAGSGGALAFRVDFNHGLRDEEWSRTPLIIGPHPDWTPMKMAPPRPLLPVFGIRIVAQTSSPMYFDQVALMSTDSPIDDPFASWRRESRAGEIRAFRLLEERLHRIEEKLEQGQKAGCEK